MSLLILLYLDVELNFDTDSEYDLNWITGHDRQNIWQSGKSELNDSGSQRKTDIRYNARW